MKIGIVILATNAYFILGIRFMKKFMHHYKGAAEITFFFFSDEDPAPYMPNNINVVYRQDKHTCWTDGTNSKFRNIISLEPELQVDYLYYFDADTNVSKAFTESWFIGDMVGGEHFGNRGFLKDGRGMDKNIMSRAYVPPDHPPYTYYYGAFFGGRTANMITFCKTLRDNQLADKLINYEPGVNDESYIQQYFHFNPPTLTVSTENFAFDISDKGGLGETRRVGLDISEHKKELLLHKDKTIEVRNNKIIII